MEIKASKHPKARRVGRKLDNLTDSQERRVKQYFKAQLDYIEAQLKKVDKGFEQVIIDAIFLKWPAQTLALKKIVEKFIPQAVETGGKDAARELPIDIDFNLQHPEVQEWMREFTGDEITNIDNTTKLNLRKLITDAVGEGLGVPDIARQIRDLYSGFSRNRARLIAHNESAQGFSQGTYAAYKQSNLVKRVEWLTAQDDKVSKGCRENAAAGPISLGSDFPSGHKVPPRHPRCRCSVLPVIE